MKAVKEARDDFNTLKIVINEAKEGTFYFFALVAVFVMYLTC